MAVSVLVNRFEGGLTDFPVGSELNQYERADNLLHTDGSAKLKSRPGSRLFDSANPQIPTGNQRISSLWNFDEDTSLVAQSAKRAFYYSAGWNELLGPTGNSFFSAGATTARVTGGDWKGHLFLTNSEGALPMKLYRDSGGTYRSITAGLPKFTEVDAYSATTVVTASIRDLANDVRSKFIAHYADAALHTTAVDAVSSALITAPALVAGNSLATAITLVTQLMGAYTSHYRDAAAATGDRLYHSNTLGDDPGQPNIQLSTQTAPVSWKQVAAMLNELKTRYNWHTRGFNIHPLAGTVVGVADLASTTSGPFADEAVPQNLLDLANDLKAAYNEHVSGPNHGNNIGSESSGAPVAFTLEDDSQITLADATSESSLVELSIQLMARYKRHHEDAVAQVFAGVASSGTTTRNKLFGGTSSVLATFGSAPNWSATDVSLKGVTDEYEGMYVGWVTGESADYGKNFARGSKIIAPSPAFSDVTPQLKIDQNNDGTVADATPKIYYFSKKRFHLVSSNLGTPTGMAPAAVDYTQMVKDLELTFATLLALAANINLHVVAANYHLISGPALLLKTSRYANSYKSYEYAFAFARSYTTFSGETFKDISAPLFKDFTVYRKSAIDGIHFSGLQSIANGATGNYDTTNTVVEIYRTINSGSTLYYVGSVPNGTTTFVDTVSDADLIANSRLYTNGGVLDNDPPPVAKFLHIMNNGIAYYGHITRTLLDGTVETVASRIEQAVQDDPDSVPSGNFVDLPLDLAGISSVRTIPVAWTSQATYRLEGTFNEQGQGSIRAVTISDRVGLVAGFSPIQVDGGVVFAGTDQFYMTDGYNLIELGKEWQTTYANLVSSATRQANMIGVYDKNTNLAWWAVSQNSNENDACYVLNLHFPPQDGKAVFTTASNGTSFAPTALAVFAGKLIRGDSRGYVFKHDQAYTSDPRVDVLSTPSTWAMKTIIFDYISSAMDFGSSLLRKWASIIELKFENVGDLSLQINSINDRGRVTKSLTPLRVRGMTGEIDEKRYFAAGGLNFSHKQIQMTNAKVVISNSDALGLAAVTGTNTVTGTFPSDMVDHVIAFEGDNYVQEFAITAQTGTTILTVAGATNGANQKWVIRGYPKTERMQLNEYTLFGVVLGATQTDAGGESGANA